MKKSVEARSETTDKRKKTAEARCETAVSWVNLPILPYGEDTFAEVEDMFSKAFIVEYGEFGTFVSKNAYWVPPLELPTAGDPMYEGYSTAQLKVAGDEAVKERAKQIAKMKECRGKAFGVLLSKLSREGEEAVKSDERYEEAENGMDPLSLWRIIKSTHSHRLDDRSRLESQYEAFRRYTVLKQMPGESVLEYKRRFELVAGNLDRMGCDYRPTEEARARHFIQSLSAAFNELRRDIANDERKKVPGAMPRTMGGAVARAREFIPSGATVNIPSTPCVYAAQKSKRRVDKRECYKCGGIGHIQKYCPKQEVTAHVTEVDAFPDIFGY